MSKPKVFIGSSVEGLKIAEAIFSHIRYETEPIIWKHGLFRPGAFPFEVLEEQLRKSDFAIMVATPDDKLEKRGEYFEAIRDNILIEFGLFAGVLGRKRTFLVLPEKQSVNIPTDLIGIMPAYYDNTRLLNDINEIEVATQEASRLILKSINIEAIEIQKKIEEIQMELAESEKGRAIQALYGVAVKIRDVIFVLQNDIAEVFSNRSKFDEVKNKAVFAVEIIHNDFKDYALKINVEKELFLLVETTKIALGSLPSPDELIIGNDEWKRQVIDTGLNAFDTYLKGGDALKEIRNKAENEAETRIESLKKRFSLWWQAHSRSIQDATTVFQDSIFKESIKIALRKG